MVAFVGPNAYGILADASRAFLELARSRDIVGHLFVLSEPGLSEAMAPLIKDGLVCCFGYAGYGATMRLGDRSAWDVLKVPFVSVLADPPYWNPEAHQVASRYVVNAYQYRDWLTMQRELVRSPQLAAVIPI